MTSGPVSRAKNIVEAFGNVKIQIMNPVQKRHAFCGLNGGFVAACVLISSTIAAVNPARAQVSDTVTNLAQLTQALDGGRHLISNLQLDATVFACDTNTGALILEDSSGAELLEMDDLNDDLKLGDLIHFEAKPALVSAGDFGIYV